MRALTVACAFFAFAAITVVSPAPTEAQASGFGVGLSLGEPTGITFEFANRGGGFGQAFEATIGLDTFDGGAYAHFLWKFYLADVARTGTLTVPIYTAIGPYVADRDRRDRDDDDIDLGARVPFGIALDFNTAPLQIFFEIALMLEIIDNPDLDVDGAVGFRYFF